MKKWSILVIVICRTGVHTRLIEGFTDEALANKAAEAIGKAHKAADMGYVTVTVFQAQ